MKAAELQTRVEKEERGLGPGGLSGTGEDGFIIELEADRRFEIGIGHGRASTGPTDMKKNFPHRNINRCRMKEQVQDSSQTSTFPLISG
jgi:hypothetical protein